MMQSQNEITYELINTSEVTQVRFFTFAQNGCYFPNHWHQALELIYLQEGTLFVTVNDKNYTLTPGTCFLFNANIIHSTRSAQFCQYILLQIPTHFLEKYLPHFNQLLFVLNDKSTNVQHQRKINIIKKLLLKMQYLHETKPDGFVLLFNSLLFKLVYQLQAKFSQKMPPLMCTSHDYKHIQILNSVLTYTVQNYARPISILEIADIAAFEPKYFCRFFKKHMGITFKDYQNELRLSYIYHDLINTNNPITAILEAHGFINYKLFRRIFKERFGDTPLRIRKKFSEI